MLEATDEFIANRRSAPILNDFYDFESDYKNRKAAKRKISESDMVSTISVCLDLVTV